MPSTALVTDESHHCHCRLLHCGSVESRHCQGRPAAVPLHPPASHDLQGHPPASHDQRTPRTVQLHLAAPVGFHFRVQGLAGCSCSVALSMSRLGTSTSWTRTPCSHTLIRLVLQAAPLCSLLLTCRAGPCPPFPLGQSAVTTWHRPPSHTRDRNQARDIPHHWFDTNRHTVGPAPDTHTHRL
jgi:hypothetical protein